MHILNLHSHEQAVSSLFKSYLNASEFPSKFHPSQYGKLHYYDSDPNSDRRPLVFIHGLGSSAQSWWILAKMLVNKRRIVMVDLFTMGGFSKTDAQGLTFSEHAHSLQDLLESITSSTVDLCGLSFGGWLSLYLAATIPEKISHVTLLNPGGVRANVFGLRNSLLYLDRKKFRSIYPGILKNFPYRKAPFFSQLAREILYRGLTAQGVRYLIASLKSEDFIDRYLPLLRCPTLLLWGRNDRLLSPQIPLELSKRVKNIRALWVEDCAHVLPLEAPVNCFKEMNHFLRLEQVQNNSFTKTLLLLAPCYSTSSIQHAFFEP